MLDGENAVLTVAHGELGKVVHGDHLGTAEIDGDVTVREREAEDTLDAVVDEGEGPGLLTVAPNLELGLGGDGLAAEGGGSLLTSTLPGTAGSVDVVETGNADVEGEVTAVRQGHLLGIQLLKTVHVLRAGRPGIALDEAGVGRILLLGLVVHAGGTGVEEVGGTTATGGLEHVHGDGGVVETEDRLVGADEAHTAHVGSKVVNLDASGGGLDGNVELAQIVEDEDVAEFIVLHELVGLPVWSMHMLWSVMEVESRV